MRNNYENRALGLQQNAQKYSCLCLSGEEKRDEGKPRVGNKSLLLSLFMFRVMYQVNSARISNGQAPPPIVHLVPFIKCESHASFSVKHFHSLQNKSLRKMRIFSDSHEMFSIEFLHRDVNS